MSSDSSMYEVGAVVLGQVDVVASWRRNSMGPNVAPMLAIQSAGQFTMLSGRVALQALREAIDEALKEPAA